MRVFSKMTPFKSEIDVSAIWTKVQLFFSARAGIGLVVIWAHLASRQLSLRFPGLVRVQAAAEAARRMQSADAEVAALKLELSASLNRLAEAQAEIIRRGRMSQLGQLTATVAHEIRNPLAAVRTSAFLLERKIKDLPVNVKPQLDRINSGITRCDAIITQLLDFTRTTAAQTVQHELDEWLVKTVEEEAEKLPAMVAVECSLNLTGEQVHFDATRLQRALVNLLSNASEAMVGKGEDPGKFATAAPKISITSRRTARGIEIAVADNGPGITEENLKKVLEPLFTTKSFGTGLGLPAVEKIMFQHGGGVDAASTPGAGATFTLWFPGTEQKQAA